jgi:hypothetical protein
VEFRLLYEGELLPSGGSNKRASEKHAIRRIFHPQVRRLWHVNKSLRQLAINTGTASLGNETNVVPANEPEWVECGIKAIGKKWSRVGYEFVPLVTPDLALRCSLDVLLLRPEEDRLIFQQGDIDGQIKTIFDALKVPKNLDETGRVGPQEDETPFFCLLEDDRLISEVRVNAEQLLLLPKEKQVKPNDCFVVIHVKLSHKNPGAFDQYFS